jgi:hypothetical protein
MACVMETWGGASRLQDWSDMRTTQGSVRCGHGREGTGIDGFGPGVHICGQQWVGRAMEWHDGRGNSQLSVSWQVPWQEQRQ